jgi:UPF0716 protein FxsA
MNVAKYLLLTAILAVLLLPLMELVAFVAVAAQIGFVPALALIAAGSFAGVLILRHAGGSHIARVRVALGEGRFTALQADGSGGLVLLAGILLAVPGFITDVVGLLLLIAPLRRAIAATFGRAQPRTRADGVVDLPPEQWRRVPDPQLPDRGDGGRQP